MLYLELVLRQIRAPGLQTAESLAATIFDTYISLKYQKTLH